MGSRLIDVLPEVAFSSIFRTYVHPFALVAMSPSDYELSLGHWCSHRRFVASRHRFRKLVHRKNRRSAAGQLFNEVEDKIEQ